MEILFSYRRAPHQEPVKRLKVEGPGLVKAVRTAHRELSFRYPHYTALGLTILDKVEVVRLGIEVVR